MILHNDELPDWFEYPSEYKILIEQNLLDFAPWIILTGESLRTRLIGVRERYPERDLIPFARREDSDDIACFEKGKKVVIIHDFASEGYEGGEASIEFWDWLRQVLEDMIDYNL